MAAKKKAVARRKKLNRSKKLEATKTLLPAVQLKHAL